MSSVHVPEVGAPDPELKNSPIAEQMEEDYEVLRREVPGEPVCYFNNEVFEHGAFVRSGTVLFRCDYGIWVDGGPADPENL